MGSIWRLVRNGLGTLLALTESGVFWMQGSELNPRGEDNRFLWGNYAPVHGDLFVPNLPVTTGKLPPEVTGLFARNGPNPAYISAGYHWFDGSGYIHSLRLDAATQTANYSGQFVQTPILMQERAAGRALANKFGDLRGIGALILTAVESIRKLVGIIDASDGMYTANTALLWHHHQLFALHEGDQPHLLHVSPEGKIRTQGRVHKAGERGKWFTAHPKIDPESKKLYAFGYDLASPPFLSFYRMDATGTEEAVIPVGFSKPCMTHDFAVTHRHAVFLEGALYVAPEDLITHPRSASLFRFDPLKPTRLAVLPLDASTPEEAVWIDKMCDGSPIPASFVFHFGNAWEEDGSGKGRHGHRLIKMETHRYEHFELDFEGTIEKPNATEKHHTWTRDELDARVAHLYEYTIDLTSSCLLSSTRLFPPSADPRGWEFPQVDGRRVGRRTRYLYATAFNHAGEGEGFVKIDPRNVSEFRVYDAREVEGGREGGGKGGLVASVVLPRRVPWGFHALWVGEKEMRSTFFFPYFFLL